MFLSYSISLSLWEKKEMDTKSCIACVSDMDLCDGCTFSRETPRSSVITSGTGVGYILLKWRYDSFKDECVGGAVRLFDCLYIHLETAKDEAEQRTLDSAAAYYSTPSRGGNDYDTYTTRQVVVFYMGDSLFVETAKGTLQKVARLNAWKKKEKSAQKRARDPEPKDKNKRDKKKARK
jgi:hypothetical protein